MKQKLLCLSEQVLSDLYSGVEANLERYAGRGFRDIEGTGGWRIELSIGTDIDGLAALDPANTSGAEIRNSKLVWKVLSRLPPSLARENRIWSRLSHIECFDYSRLRWLRNGAAPDQVRRHFFADTLTKCRDDHAIARLWWNAYIAHLAMPGDHDRALEAMLKTADIRSNIVERRFIFSRPPVAAGIVRAILDNPAATSTEQRFRDFMKAVNRYGSGIVFEVMDADTVDAFLRDCLAKAL